jgi:hypothetical protein
MGAAIPDEAGVRVCQMSYRRLARRWMALMDAAICQGTGDDSQRWESVETAILLPCSDFSISDFSFSAFTERRSA